MTELYQNILLPVDGSQESIEAFKTGVQQAKAWESNIYLVQVHSEDSTEIKIDGTNSFLTSLEDYANKQGVFLHKELVYGDPRLEIAENLVDRWDIDLIVMGATGKGTIAKMIIGSVTTYVVRQAKCDVLISR